MRWLGGKTSSCGVAFVLALTWAVPARAGSVREEMAFADESVGRMQSDASALRASLAAARAQKDAVKTLCVNDKLSKMEAAVRGAQDARATLRRAGLREDQDAIAGAAAKLRAFDAQARQLRSEADQCVGEQATTVEKTEVYGVQQVYRDVAEDDSIEADLAGATSVHAPAFAAGQSPSPARPSAPSVPAAPSSPASGAVPSSPFAPTPTSAASPYSAEAPHDAAMLAYVAEMTLGVFEVDKQMAAVEAIATDAGGYLSQRNDSQITVRIPKGRFADAMRRVEKLGDVLHRSVTAEDVTDEYVDLELRLKNARETRDRLAELLKSATVKDAVEIEKELAKVTEVVEQIEGRLKLLRDRVGYSTLTVSFQQSTPSATVRSTAILPFSWLDTMGLAPLLNVPKVSP